MRLELQATFLVGCGSEGIAMSTLIVYEVRLDIIRTNIDEFDRGDRYPSSWNTYPTLDCRYSGTIGGDIDQTLGADKRWMRIFTEKSAGQDVVLGNPGCWPA
jgi:hypothetical protein